MANINVKVNPVTTTSVAIGANANTVKQVAIGQVAAENIDLDDLRNVDTTTVIASNGDCLVYDASNDGASAKLYIEAVDSGSSADIHIIGGKYYTDLLDHTKGTLTANSAILTDSSSKIDVLNVDNVTINGNDISSTNSNGQITLTPNGTGYVNINKNDGFKLPAGTTAQRLGSPVAGLIRYNSTLSTFEGYGTAWGSLGGVIDVDQDTKITAESAAGQDEDVLTFYIGVSNSAQSQMILADGVLKPTADDNIDLGTNLLEFKNAWFDGTVNIDALVADTADINAGSIDGVTLGTNSPITNAVIDDVSINGKVITMTGSSGDTAVLTAGSNGSLSIVTVDAGGAAANIQITADGTVDIDSAGVLTLDSGAAINLEPADGSAILLDGTISVDAGVVTGATSITSTAFVGTLSTAAQANVTSLGTLTGLTVSGATTLNGAVSLGDATGDVITFTGRVANGAIVPVNDNQVDLGASSLEFKDLFLDGTANIDSLVADTADINGGSIDGVTIGTNSVVTDLRVDNLKLDANTISSTNSNGDITIAPNGTGNVVASTDRLSITSASDEAAALYLTGGEANVATIVLQADESDDNGDDWTITAGVDDTLKIFTDKSGSNVAAITITNNATIASATTAIATGLTVAGTTTFSGGVDMGSQATTNVNIDSGAIDGVTLGTNSPITNAQIDNININGNTVSSTDTNGHITLTPNGTGNVAVNSDTVSITGGEAESASLFLIADESDDASDDWAITANTNNTLQISNDIASAGTQVAFLTLTPHATVASSTLAALGNVTIAGNLTVSGSTTTVSSTNTTIADKLVELGTGSTGSASGDVGHVFERGDDANIFVGWDESSDTFISATGSFTGATTGNLTIASYTAAKFGSLTLTTDLAVSEGGTGVSSFTDKGIVYGDGSNALDVTAAPGGADVTTSFQILTAGSGNGNPVWTTTIDGGTY
jgi:hypothetical protein